MINVYFIAFVSACSGVGGYSLYRDLLAPVAPALSLSTLIEHTQIVHCCSHINSHNQVRGHRAGSSHSGAEEYPREKHTHPKVVNAYITADAIHASTRNI